MTLRRPSRPEGSPVTAAGLKQAMLMLDVFLDDFWVYNMWISTSNQLQFSCMRSHNTRTMLATEFYIFYIRQSTLRDLENDVFQIYREITPNL